MRRSLSLQHLTRCRFTPHNPHHPHRSFTFSCPHFSPTNSPSVSTPHTDLPSPSSQPHSSLSTFLHYATTTALSPTSTLYTGTLYEYLVLSTLSQHAFSLSRVGGRSDAGIDLLGHWALPSSLTPAHQPNPVPVIVQCKNLARAPGPSLIRELEGALTGAPRGWRGEGTMGVLVTTGKATKGVREAMGRSGMGLVFFMVEMVRDEGESGWKGSVRQCLWNKRAGAMALDGVEAGVRYVTSETTTDGGVEKEVVLSYREQRIGSAVSAA